MEEELKVSEDSSTVDPFSELAKNYGWDPNKGGKSSKEFIEYAMQNLEPRGKELKEVKQTLAKVESHIENLAQERYERKLQALEQRKLAAIESQDVAEIDKVFEEKKQLQQTQIEQAKPESLIDLWAAKHSALINDKSLEAFDIKQFIYLRDKDLMSRKLSVEEHLAILEHDMYKKYPEYFNITQAKAAPEKDSQSSSNAKKTVTYTFKDLSPIQQEIALAGEKKGRSIDVYIAGLVKNGVLK